MTFVSSGYVGGRPSHEMQWRFINFIGLLLLLSSLLFCL
jgi:hypothetical protein